MPIGYPSKVLTRVIAYLDNQSRFSRSFRRPLPSFKIEKLEELGVINEWDAMFLRSLDDKDELRAVTNCANYMAIDALFKLCALKLALNHVRGLSAEVRASLEMQNAVGDEATLGDN